MRARLLFYDGSGRASSDRNRTWMSGSTVMAKKIVIVVQLVLFSCVVWGVRGNDSEESLLSSPLKSISNLNHGDHYDPMSFGEPPEHSPQTPFLPHFAQPTCEPIKISMCSGLGYNDTVMPNRVGHDAQIDADALLQTFAPLIQYGCSSELKLFLCSAYVPMCTDKVPEPIGPCRSFCLSVRSKCEPVLTEFGFTWPDSLNCDHFHPQNNHQHMCIPGMHPPATPRPPLPPSDHSQQHHSPNLNSFSKSGKTIPFLPSLSSPPLGDPFNRFVTHDDPPPISLLPPTPNKLPGHVVSVTSTSSLSCGRRLASRGECWTRCPSPHRQSQGQSQGHSDEPEEGHLFMPQDKVMARHFLLTTALVTLVASFIAILIATTCARRRSSPQERPILYMAFCQLFYSVGVVAGTWSGGVACVVDKVSGEWVVARGPLLPPTCSLLFLLTFFFSLAALLWWLLLPLSWLLSFSQRHAHSLQTRETSAFHLLVWPTASVLTCVLLLKKHAEGDELTGLCGVGYQSSSLLLHYELLPLLLMVCLGVLLLLLGMTLYLRKRRQLRRFSNNLYQSVSMSHHHHHHHHPHTRHNHLASANLQKKEESRKAWHRVLLFSLVQLVPLLVQLAVLCYEVGLPQTRTSDLGSSTNSNLVLFLLTKHLMKLVGGILCLVWALIVWVAFGGQFNCFSAMFPKIRLSCGGPGGGGSVAGSQSQAVTAVGGCPHSNPNNPSEGGLVSSDSGGGVGFFSRIGPLSSANGMRESRRRRDERNNLNGRSLPPVPHPPVPLPLAIPVPIPVVHSIPPHHSHGHHGHGMHPTTNNISMDMDGNDSVLDGSESIVTGMNAGSHVFCGLRTETWRRGETIV